MYADRLSIENSRRLIKELSGSNEIKLEPQRMDDLLSDSRIDEENKTFNIMQELPMG